jgi:hypothetical protein
LIRTSVADATIEDDDPARGVRAYWARVHAGPDGQVVQTEGDLEVLAAYGQALVKGWLRSELLEQIALRGLIGFFFNGTAETPDASSQVQQGGSAPTAPDESKEDTEAATSKLRKGLLSACMSAAPPAIVRKLLTMDGSHDAAVEQEAAANAVERRRQIVEQICGAAVMNAVTQKMAG